MWRFVLVFVLLTATARAQEQSTAYDALLVVGKQFSRAAVQRIISVTGVDGDPQPVRWTVLIADRRSPSGVRELQVANGRIVSNRPGEGGGTAKRVTIKTSQLNLDSSGAFTVANHTADQSHTNFDRVAYTLRTSERGTPVWIVTIQDKTRRPLGTIHIAANRGNVTRVEGMYRGRNIDQVEQDPVAQQALSDGSSDAEADARADVELTDEGEVEASDGDENFVKAEIKRMFRRTKSDARRLFQRVHRSFDDFFRGED